MVDEKGGRDTKSSHPIELGLVRKLAVLHPMPVVLARELGQSRLVRVEGHIESRVAVGVYRNLHPRLRGAGKREGWMRVG